MLLISLHENTTTEQKQSGWEDSSCWIGDRSVMFILMLSSLLFLQSSAGSLWKLKSNVLVVNVEVGKDENVDVPLICGEAYEGQNVTWIRNKDEKLDVEGNRIVVTVEGWKGANYSCFSSDGSYLNHTLVLAQWNLRKFIKKTPEKGYIHCTTNSYGRSFQCNWTWENNRDGHVTHIEATRPHGGGNISCSLESKTNITCLDSDYCQYAEELNRINLTIYFRSSFVVESYNSKFYIMDIVKPDQVAISRINKTSVEVRYPHSWNKPSSYFPLIFQVKEIRRKCKNCDCSKPGSPEIYITQSHQLPVRKGMTVCVRARDEFCDSSWSQWSQYRCKKEQNKRERKQGPKLKML